MSRANKPRIQKRTILIVGEGADEKAFLDYLKGELIGRGAGLSITTKNAKGKGAKGVIDWTIRQAGNAQYDKVAALFDTDQDWSPTVEAKAKRHKIILLKSEPCFEAMMLRLLGVTPHSNPKHLKSQFSPFVKDEATLKENYSHHFGMQTIKGGRDLEPAIDELLSLFGIKKNRTR
jgi:hypothetical protein